MVGSTPNPAFIIPSVRNFCHSLSSWLPYEELGFDFLKELWNPSEIVGLLVMSCLLLENG
jgi:hypothetical protein